MIGVSTPDREAPLRVRAIAAGVPPLPAGRYWMVHQLRRVAVRPFMMRLPARLSAGHRAWTISHSPGVHRHAARVRVGAAELVRPDATRAAADAWPHIVAAAPGAPDPA